MRCRSLLILGLAVGLVPTAASRFEGRPAPARAAEASMVPGYGMVPLSFERNRGQADPRVRYLARGGGYGLFLTSVGGRPLAPRGRTRRARAAGPAPEARRGARRAVVRLKLLGASRTPEISASDPLSGKGHYFLGADPGRWRKDVAQYGRVRYRQVYPGVDLVYHGRQGRLEYDFVLSPGSDPRAIRIGLDGAQATQLDGGGNLVVETGAGRLVQQAPLVYQEIDGQRREVTGAYVLHGEREVGFAVGHCDADHPLVIDPVLEYSTYLGAAPATEARPSRRTASAAPT